MGGGVGRCRQHMWTVDEKRREGSGVTWQGGMRGREEFEGQELAEEGAPMWLRMSLSLWPGPHFLGGAASWVGREATPDLLSTTLYVVCGHMSVGD